MGNLMPPNPAELIPTLKEHEWVRGTVASGMAFGPVETDMQYGSLWAWPYKLMTHIRVVSDFIKTIERCDAPEVVK